MTSRRIKQGQHRRSLLLRVAACVSALQAADLCGRRHSVSSNKQRDGAAKLQCRSDGRQRRRRQFVGFVLRDDQRADLRLAQ